jgi:GntR family transcriptional regulator
MAVRLHFQIDAHSGVPVYRQLMDQMKYYVASGTLVSGDQLPSIRELAQSLTLNPATIVKAYNELAHEQVIELRQGKGAFVAAQANLLSERERDRALRRIARQLAVEASQMGTDLDQALRIVEEEMEAVRENPGVSQTLDRLSAMNSRR